jgi:hypothetical protein
MSAGNYSDPAAAELVAKTAADAAADALLGPEPAPVTVSAQAAAAVTLATQEFLSLLLSEAKDSPAFTRTGALERGDCYRALDSLGFREYGEVMRAGEAEAAARLERRTIEGALHAQAVEAERQRAIAHAARLAKEQENRRAKAAAAAASVQQAHAEAQARARAAAEEAARAAMTAAGVAEARCLP